MFKTIIYQNCLKGAYRCQCIDGFSGDGFTCTDIDECEVSPCDEFAQCTNTAGSFTCECKNGLSGNGFICDDIDECKTDPCDTNASCYNEQGIFYLLFINFYTEQSFV